MTGLQGHFETTGNWERGVSLKMTTNLNLRSPGICKALDIRHIGEYKGGRDLPLSLLEF